MNKKRVLKSPILLKLLEKVKAFSVKVFLEWIFENFPDFASVTSQSNISPVEPPSKEPLRKNIILGFWGILLLFLIKLRVKSI
jgi:hypothetical protein